MILSNSVFNRDRAWHARGRAPHRTAVWLPLAAWLLLLGHAGARTLTVGADQELTNPSAAAREAESGDTVNIEPGEILRLRGVEPEPP